MGQLRGRVGYFGTRRPIDEVDVGAVEERISHRARFLTKHYVWCLAWDLSSIEIYHSYKAYFIYFRIGGIKFRSCM